MRRKITLAFLVIFASYAAGAALALVYIKSTTETVRNLSELHRIEEIRQHLTASTRSAQADLYTTTRSSAGELDEVIEHVRELESAAESCLGCHHRPDVQDRIHRVQSLVAHYQEALSQYIVASADNERILRLKLEAAGIANELMASTEQMAFQASAGVQDRTEKALYRFDRAGVILTVSIVVTLLVSMLVALRLTLSITRPIEQLVTGTRALAQGDLGFSVRSDDRTELGELAQNFNSMSAALSRSYSSLQAEVEERKKAQTRLVHDAFHDALTGLPNRALFVDRLEHALAAAGRRDGESFAVLFLDLDRFKVVNDSMGHGAGDQLLVEVAERLLLAVRGCDTVARQGGDEFAILLEQLKSETEAIRVAERIIASLNRPIDLQGREIFATASIGIALQSEGYQRPDEVLRDADIAMYQAKQRGRACFEIFDAQMHGSVVEKMQLEADLRQALEKGDQLVLYYQPIVALPSRALLGLEALVRWKHPTRGLLAAGQFVPVAEESGLVVPLGNWVLGQALSQLRAWQQRQPALAATTVSVNVSGRQFRRPDCVEVISRIVRQSGIDPRQLALEVTESIIMDDVEASADKLAVLRQMGSQIHVDDFGTGYSSLSYLHRFPISAVKIDRSFVTGLPAQSESIEVIRAIVSIADSLRFQVIAEGIEREEQAAKLEELRCHQGQGYLISRPGDAEAIERWVESFNRRVA